MTQRKLPVPARYGAPLLLLALALPLVPAAPAGEDWPALRNEFRAKMLLDRKTGVRFELVDRVAEVGTREAAEALLDAVAVLGEKIDGLARKLARVEAEHEKLNSDQDLGRDNYKTRDRLRAEMMDLDERIMAEREVLDRIRRGLARFTAEDARRYVASRAVKGETWRQRAVAARTAAAYPAAYGLDAALRALRDSVPAVVVEVLDALGARKDEAAAGPVAALLLHDDWSVAVAAARALAAIGSVKPVGRMIEALGKTDGRVRDEINSALRAITGENFAADYEIWKRWYEENKERLAGPDARKLRRGKKAPKPNDSDFYGIRTPSKKIMYVIDISGSMNLEIGGKQALTQRPGEREKLFGKKIEIAKTELKHAIRRLPEDAWFDIITFNHLVKVWRPRMVQATQKQKNEAYKFIRDLKASGSTYTYGALKEAFKFATDSYYKVGIDTIFLLSDGAPTDQTYPTSKLMDAEIILKAVRQWNRVRKVTIHAIAIDPKAQGPAFIRFMKDLATQNGGRYIEKGG